MERICLRIKRLRLASLKSIPDEEGTVFATVELGNALNITHVRIGYEGKGGPFHQNWSMASLRFLDVPILHKGEKEKNNSEPLLEDIVREAILLFFKGGDAFPGNDARLRYLLGQQLGGFDLEEFNLRQNGRELLIPVQFIRMSKFDCRHQNGDVRVNIQLGHHLIVWNVKIYDGKGVFEIFDDNIRDPKLRKIIREMIQRNMELQKHVKHLSQNGTSDLGETVFIDKSEGCDPKSVPPPVSFC